MEPSLIQPCSCSAADAFTLQLPSMCMALLRRFFQTKLTQAALQIGHASCWGAFLLHDLVCGKSAPQASSGVLHVGLLQGLSQAWESPSASVCSHLAFMAC